MLRQAEEQLEQEMTDLLQLVDWPRPPVQAAAQNRSPEVAAVHHELRTHLLGGRGWIQAISLLAAPVIGLFFWLLTVYWHTGSNPREFAFSCCTIAPFICVAACGWWEWRSGRSDLDRRTLVEIERLSPRAGEEALRPLASDLEWLSMSSITCTADVRRAAWRLARQLRRLHELPRNLPLPSQGGSVQSPRDQGGLTVF